MKNIHELVTKPKVQENAKQIGQLNTLILSKKLTKGDTKKLQRERIKRFWVLYEGVNSSL